MKTRLALLLAVISAPLVSAALLAPAATAGGFAAVTWGAVADFLP